MRLLGIANRSSLPNWESKAHRQALVHLDRNTIERISYVLGIFKAINTVLPIPERADRWMRSANNAPLFGGRSALDRMTAGNVSDLYVVRRFLDGQIA